MLVLFTFLTLCLYLAKISTYEKHSRYHLCESDPSSPKKYNSWERIRSNRPLFEKLKKCFIRNLKQQIFLKIIMQMEILSRIKLVLLACCRNAWLWRK
ncbi:hypothetical protein BD408DRAFT_408267 [Parasitella parasitica]|nr:hypothetical protein BD408DRAFT_408267 [Parasitella parasitica]